MVAAEGLIQTALLGEAVDAGPALIFVADETMRYIAINQRACVELGYSREELLALTVDKVAQARESYSEFDEMLMRGERDGHATLTRKDGTKVEFTYRAKQITAAGLRLYVSVGFV